MSMKKTLLLILLTFVFTCIIFILKNYLLFDVREQIEEQYIEPTVSIEEEIETELLTSGT